MSEESVSSTSPDVMESFNSVMIDAFCKDSIAGLDEHIESYQHSIAKMKLQIQDHCKALAEKFENKYSEIKTTISSLQAKIDETNEICKKEKLCVTTLSVSVKELETENTGLKTANTGLTTENTGLKEKCENLNGVIENSETINQKLSEQNFTLEDEISKLKDDCKGLREEVENYERGNRKLCEQNIALSTENNMLILQKEEFKKREDAEFQEKQKLLSLCFSRNGNASNMSINSFLPQTEQLQSINLVGVESSQMNSEMDLNAYHSQNGQQMLSQEVNSSVVNGDGTNVIFAYAFDDSGNAVNVNMQNEFSQPNNCFKDDKNIRMSDDTQTKDLDQSSQICQSIDAPDNTKFMSQDLNRSLDSDQHKENKLQDAKNSNEITNDATNKTTEVKNQYVINYASSVMNDTDNGPCSYQTFTQNFNNDLSASNRYVYQVIDSTNQVDKALQNNVSIHNSQLIPFDGNNNMNTGRNDQIFENQYTNLTKTSNPMIKEIDTGTPKEKDTEQKGRNESCIENNSIYHTQDNQTKCNTSFEMYVSGKGNDILTNDKESNSTSLSNSLMGTVDRGQNQTQINTAQEFKNEFSISNKPIFSNTNLPTMSIHNSSEHNSDQMLVFSNNMNVNASGINHTFNFNDTKLTKNTNPMINSIETNLLEGRNVLHKIKNEFPIENQYINPSQENITNSNASFVDYHFTKDNSHVTNEAQSNVEVSKGNITGEEPVQISRQNNMQTTLVTNQDKLSSFEYFDSMSSYAPELGHIKQELSADSSWSFNSQYNNIHQTYSNLQQASNPSVLEQKNGQHDQPEPKRVRFLLPEEENKQVEPIPNIKQEYSFEQSPSFNQEIVNFSEQLSRIRSGVMSHMETNYPLNGNNFSFPLPDHAEQFHQFMNPPFRDNGNGGIATSVFHGQLNQNLLLQPSNYWDESAFRLKKESALKAPQEGVKENHIGSPINEGNETPEQEESLSLSLTPVSPQEETTQNISSVGNNRGLRMRGRRGRGRNRDRSHQRQLSEMSVRGLDLLRYATLSPDGTYRCIECDRVQITKNFKNKYSFQRHAFLYHEGAARKVFPCTVCKKEFSRPDKMKQHLKQAHEGFDKNAAKNARSNSNNAQRQSASQASTNSLNTVSTSTVSPTNNFNSLPSPPNFPMNSLTSQDATAAVKAAATVAAMAVGVSPSAASLLVNPFLDLSDPRRSERKTGSLKDSSGNH